VSTVREVTMTMPLNREVVLAMLAGLHSNHLALAFCVYIRKLPKRLHQ